VAYEKSSWDAPTYNPSYEGPSFPDMGPDDPHEKSTAKQLRSHGLWNTEDDPETPYSNEVSNTFYGAK